METYRGTWLKELGIDADFLQDNHCISKQQVVRGLHYQIKQPQGKLVRVISGEVFDVAVDLRRSSPNFGQWVGEYLSAENRKIMWIPPGFAHGFYVVAGPAELLYKCTAYYAPEHERTLMWNDATIGIRWPLREGEQPVLSEKDKSGLPFGQAETFD